MLPIPVEITDSLARFTKDHPDSSRAAFILMKFQESKAHRDITATIRAALASHGMSAARADDRQYHDDKYWNIMTYIYGCGFGVAVFERLQADEFNPNVSFEYGYMRGIGKHVCLLKDQTLPRLHGDLDGKLYRPFDTQNARLTIPPQIATWLTDHSLI